MLHAGCPTLRFLKGGIPRLFLVQKHYCECRPFTLTMFPRFWGNIDETVEAERYLTTLHLCADDFFTCCGPGLSGRKI
jgi:hypothetical protein